MTQFTQRFTEAWNPIARINPASYAAEQNTARVDMSLYQRAVVHVMVGAIAGGANVTCKIEQHNAASGGTTKDVTGKAITTLTQAGSDSNKIVAIELRSEELDISNDFHWISVEIIPSGATLLGVQVFAGVASYEPVSTANYDEVVD